MAQTPQQRRANEAYAKAESQKRGKSVTETKKRDVKPSKSPVSQGWVLLLLFVTVGGIVFELVRIAFGAGEGWFS